MRTGTAALLVATLGLIWSGSAAAAITVPPASTPQTLTFAGGLATLSITVINTGAGGDGIEATYVGSGVSSDGLKAGGAAAPTGLRLTGPTPATIPAGSSTVELTFHRTTATPDVNGAIVLRSGDSVAALSVVQAAAEAKRFVQTTDTISAASWSGPLARGCRSLRRFVSVHWCPGGAYQGSSLTVEATGAVDHETVIGGDNGRTMRVRLLPLKAPGTARLEVEGVPSPSSYSGTVGLTSAGSSGQTASITVHTRDALIWPLLALGLGVLLSYLLTVDRNPQRTAEGQRLSLEEALQKYRLARRDDPLRPDRNYLDALLSLNKRRRPKKDDAQCVGPDAKRPTKRFPRLFYDTYSIGDADARTATASAVADMLARFARWQQLNNAFRVLEPLVRQLPPTLVIYREGLSKLDLVQGEPGDDDEVKSRVDAMTAFAFVVHVYLDVKREWDGKSDDFHRAYPHLNPAEIYREAPRTKPEEVEKLKLTLLQLRRVLAHDDIPPRNPALSIQDNLRAVIAVTEARHPAPKPSAPPRVGPSIHVFRDPAAIRRHVREWDTAVFVIVSFLTALAYALGFYAGKDWGSPTDYLLAFASGATVPTVINWALAPSARTLTTTATAKATT